MPGAAHAMVEGQPSQVHCSQPKMEGPASQLSAQQPHHHPQQHIQSHPSHASQQHSQLHAPSPHQQLMQQQQQQHQVPQQQALQHQLSQHHHQQLQPPSQQQHQQQHQQQQPQQSPGLHPSHHPGEIKGVPVSVTQHIQSPQQTHVVTSAHIKAEGFAMPSQAMGRVGSASRTPPAPVPRQMTLVEGVVASRSQGPPQPQGPAIMTQAPTKIHEQRAPVGSKGSLLGNQHAAKQTGGFLQPPFGVTNPQACPEARMLPLGAQLGWLHLAEA
uniref:Uncharacterized protein n=1 Tax=Rhipicephalus microplus TaxID=6941 RepID=A0A6G4ZY09_RHIMP